MTTGVAELAAGYRDGSRSPVEAVEACLGAIDALDSRVGAWQAVYADEARQAARAAERALADAAPSGQRLGPFFGVPFALKDIVDTEGRVTTAGCAEWSERVSPSTAVIARRLLDAGGILLGKTKTVEFALGGWGTNQRMGTPQNPWDAEVARTPGGSSSGTGAAVAAGMAPCGVGTDTGGSVRLPASFCGIVGLKTTEGLLPIEGIVPLSPTLDTPGPMTRSAMDAALMFDAMLGSAPRDVERDWLAGAGRYRDLRRAADGQKGVLDGLRIACFGDSDRSAVEPDQLAGYDAALDLLADLGAEVVPFELPASLEEMKEITFVIVTAEAYHFYGDLMNDPSSRVDENVRARVRPGVNITASDYIAASLRRQADQAKFLAAFEGFDALATPTTPMLAQPVAVADEGGTPAGFTRAANYLAMCATAVPSGVAPAGKSADGSVPPLPMSIQFMCRGGDETRSLSLAAAYEAARGPMPNPPLWAGG